MPADALVKLLTDFREECARVAAAHAGSAAKRRGRRKLGTYDEETRIEIVAEERGEDIAAAMIAAAIRALPLPAAEPVPEDVRMAAERAMDYNGYSPGDEHVMARWILEKRGQETGKSPNNDSSRDASGHLPAPAPSPPTPPEPREEWVWVPREPTQEMLKAAEREWDGRMSARSAGVWQAMLSAAPARREGEHD